jgi:hypothetical protein
MASTEPRKRMTLSEVVEALLSRNSPEHSSVTLIRNSKGETQIEVTVRSDAAGDVTTADQAAEKAVELYDTLRARYPSAAGFTGPPEGA